MKFEEEEEEEEKEDKEDEYEDGGTIRVVRVSNEVKFNFVKALTQFGKETAKGGRKFQVSRSIG